MTKIRVHELAKEFDLTSKEMVERIMGLGIDIKDYRSCLEDEDVERVRRSFKKQQEAEKSEEAGAPQQVIVRRKQKFKIRKKIIIKESLAPPLKEVPLPSAEEAPRVVSVKKEEKEKEEALRPKGKKKRPPEKKKAEPTPPKRLVKIIDMPRVEIPLPEKREHVPPQKPRVEKEAAKSKEAAYIAPPEEVLTAPEKPVRKQDKRVVKLAEIEEYARKRKPVFKKEKAKPIKKILMEEIDILDQAPYKEPGAGVKKTKPVPSRKEKFIKEKPAPVTMPPKAGKRKIAIYETIQVGELAQKMGVKLGDIIKKLMGMGVIATANQSIDYETAVIIASEYDYEVEKRFVAEDLIHIAEEEGGEARLRSPVITVMGHVDHGKTSLLDAIRDADVVSKEAGGITQHIGAYHVTLSSGHEVVFLDTPGHESFTAMRARGAKVTDIVLLVVAADDGVMAQTREAIDHSKAANVPIIVAVNKIDKPGANPDRVKTQLSEIGLTPEEWGGDTIFVNISAKKRIGIEELLEMLALQSEVMELKAVPDKPAKGHVIEAKLDKGRGPVATLLVSDGTLHTGDTMVCGLHFGKIRAMINDKGEMIKSAGPSMPVEVIGLSGIPEAGNEFVVLPDEKKAKEVADYRQRKQREAELVKASKISLESVFEKMKEQEIKELNIILKTDVQGSIEAISDALLKLSTQEIKVNIVRSGIGAIVDSDVLLASASNGIIIGFNVRPTLQAKYLAEHEGVDIRFYDIIYDAIEDVKKAMLGMLEPVYEEKIIGHAQVRQTFQVPKIGVIAGSYVTDGIVMRNAQARLLRDNVVVYTGKISSLRRFKEDAKEVSSGYECGIGLENFNDIKIDDVIEAYQMEEKAPELK